MATGERGNVIQLTLLLVWCMKGHIYYPTSINFDDTEFHLFIYLL
jgi:hypothetical protein